MRWEVYEEQSLLGFPKEEGNINDLPQSTEMKFYSCIEVYSGQQQYILHLISQSEAYLLPDKDVCCMKSCMNNCW